MSQKRPKKIHRGITRGKMCFVITREGEYITERFMGSRGSRVFLETRSFLYSEIRTLTIARAIPRIPKAPTPVVEKEPVYKRRHRQARQVRGMR